MSSGRPTSERLAFERIRVRRLPGFERQGFELSGLSPEINVIHGPNASGKTTVARAVRLLLWPPEGAGATGVSLEAAGRLGDRDLQIEIDHGRIERRAGGAPLASLPLPPAEHAERYRLALHEILQEGARGEELARQVAREALGGYDVDAALEALGALEKVTYSRKADAAFKAAEARVRALTARQLDLEREAAGLDRLRGELDEAREAGRRLREVEAALHRLAAAERRAEAERRVAAFPAAVARLTGEEAGRLERLAEEIAAAEAERESLERRLRDARSRLGEAPLPPTGVEEELLGRLENRARELAALEQERGLAGRELAAARARREKARAALGERATGPLLEAVGEAVWAELLALARRAEHMDGERARIEGEEAGLGDESPESEAPDPAALEQGSAYLRAWLRFSAATPRARLASAVALGLLLGAGVAGGILVHPGLWALAGVAVLLALWVESDARDQRRVREALEAKYEALGRGAPAAWKRDAVEALLERLERRWLEGKLAAEDRRRREERRRTLADERRRLEEREKSVERDRADLLERLGLAPEIDRELEPAPLAALAQALASWREAAADVAGREAATGELGQRREDLLAGLASEVGDRGVAPPSDAAGALAAVGELRRRSEIRVEIDRLEGPGGEIGRLGERLDRLTRERADLYRRLDLEPGDDAGFQALEDRFEPYRQAVRERDEARVLLDAAAAPTDEAPSGRSAAELEAEHDLLAERTERHDELLRGIAELETRIGEAKGQHELEEALAARERAEEELGADRGRVAAGRVAYELGEWLKGQVQARHRPEVMRRAGELFAQITRGRFRLLDPTGARPRFGAWDSAADRSRGLEELSSGTRLQLLAAVRLAFIEIHERGLRPPLVLDETLANSDDASARALIEAAVDVARSGRQVLYLTAQDDEVAKWRAVVGEQGDAGPELRVIDLARARNLAADGPEAERRAAARRQRAWSPAASAVPAPEGRSREEYAALLEVPGIDPRARVGGVHLAHLVEEPEVLHGLLRQGVVRWGQLEALVGSAGADGEVPAGLPGLGTEEAGRRRWLQMRARARALEALLLAWRQGRGEPVDRGALAESGAVTERFLDEVSDLASSLGGDARALMEALAEGRVKGFRSDKREQLEEYLAAHGHLDERPVLGRSALRERARTALAAEVAAGELDQGAVDELLAAILGGPPADLRDEG